MRRAGLLCLMLVLTPPSIEDRHEAGEAFSPLYARRLSLSIGGMDRGDRREPERLAGRFTARDFVASANPASACLGSVCSRSYCLGSVCLGSGCLGSACGTSQCIGSLCAASACGGSLCVASGCLGSVCGGSICVGSLCGRGCALEPGWDGEPEG